MADTHKLHMVFKDRVGIVADISSLAAKHGFSIISMEVKRQQTHTDIFFEVSNEKKTHGLDEFLDILGQTPDLRKISITQILPHEARENRFRVVLDNISDGVVSIDHEGKVTVINTMAAKMLGLKDEQFLGKPVKELPLPDHGLLESLRGAQANNVKKSSITPHGRLQYFVTRRPIIDNSGQIIGAVEIAKDMQEIKKLANSISKPKQITFSDVIGEHPSIKQAISFAQKIAGAESVISLRGASGTGKELFARAIHTASQRAGSFVPINCAALPESLLESELFGYEAGAFTGAQKQGKPGLFEQANEGTIFLDEIGELPAGPQAKILRVIQDKRVRRIGGSKEIPVNTRIITATNQNLEQMVEAKTFRQDLYYRINVLPIHIPPLRQRKEDIPILAEHFLFQFASRLDRPAATLSPRAQQKLMGHSWPGNVREFRNVIERAAILSNGEEIDDAHILFSHELSNGPGSLLLSVSSQSSQDDSLPTMVADYEKGIIKEALNRTRSIRQAARKLGVSHTALLNKMKKYYLSLE